MTKIGELNNLMAEAAREAQKFYTKGNKTAGTRLRKIMQEIKTVAQEVRAEVQELKK